MALMWSDNHFTVYMQTFIVQLERQSITNKTIATPFKHFYIFIHEQFAHDALSLALWWHCAYTMVTIFMYCNSIPLSCVQYLRTCKCILYDYIALDYVFIFTQELQSHRGQAVESSSWIIS